MPKHWTTTLKCPECHTVIRYEDETPPWRESEELVARREAARAFVAEHEGETVVGFLASGSTPEEKKLAAEARGLSPFIRYSGAGLWPYAGRILGVDESHDLRCVDCPACGAEIFIEHAIDPTDSESDNA